MKGKLSFLVCLIFMFPVALADLRIGFYNETCPGAESIISGVVQTAFASDKSITPALVRMYFHDCFNAVSHLYACMHALQLLIHFIAHMDRYSFYIFCQNFFFKFGNLLDFM